MARPFDSYNDDAIGPVVLAVTHAGRDYPPEIGERLAIPLERARPLEDRLADLLVEAAKADGHRVLIARVPRLMIDLNRAETDFEARAVSGAREPAPRPSHRARGGLGLVPERLGHLRLWRHPLHAAELAERIRTVHRPWHAAVAAALAHAQDANGYAILLDVHSMPMLAGVNPAQVVIGDRHGASALPAMTATAVSAFREARLKTAVNNPYAGAYTLDRHGRPSQGVSALQIEVDRRLYLDDAQDLAGSGLDRIQQLIARLAQRLSAALSADLPLAAE